MRFAELLWRDPGREGPGAPDLHPVIEDGKGDGPSGDGIIPMDERVDENLTHGVHRNKRGLDAAQSPGHDLGWHGEVSLAEKLRLLKQFERRSADLPLVEELGLIRAAKPRHAELALRIVGHEFLAEEYHGGLQYLPVPA